MILTREEICKLILKKKVIIEPIDVDAIGPASIDLTLDNKIRVFRSKKAVIEDTDYAKLTTIKDISKGYVIKPGELVLGITKEKITLPPNICGWLNSRSSYARIGLMSHITAPFIAPGVANHQVLEIFNCGKNSIMLKPGMKICHLVLQECRGKSSYQGRFKDQVI
jgi:dCTP deaminase